LPWRAVGTRGLAEFPEPPPVPRDPAGWTSAADGWRGIVMSPTGACWGPQDAVSGTLAFGWSSAWVRAASHTASRRTADTADLLHRQRQVCRGITEGWALDISW